MTPDSGQALPNSAAPKGGSAERRCYADAVAKLKIVNVTAGYRGKKVLHDISLEYGRGIHVLLGPNGAGKTTTFRVLAGILPPMEGTVLVDGRDPHVDVAAKELVGLATHRSALAPRLNVVDNLRYWARVLGLSPGTAEERIEEVLALLGLAGLADQRVAALSRGQNQRAGLAKAFLGSPPVLLLDEPMSGLDPDTTQRLSGHLRKLADDGHTVVVSTHALADAYRLADDVTVLQDGRVAGRGEPAALRSELLGDAYRLRIRGSGDVPAALERLGHRWRECGPGAVEVEVADEAATETLVAQLVREGVGLREVVPARNPLEDVYRQLAAADGGDAG
ncbi:ABC transporter ATP-binding protein [Streptomyces sp. NBC_01483]|uniref:ABC transporter ATP-binding protein n=1 Tax=Streptomyces sp. NBC_01483 TaxID=2903883 RepID=UPI002E379495|nr:ABC transporter ATP-binding protein [Streptomyces sp. NBC_01483]